MHDHILHESFDVPRGTQRFRELILYVARQCRHDHWFGAVKLNKILYHADFRAFERFGTPLTGVRYFRLPMGPAPKMMVPVRRQLVEEGALRIERREVGPHHVQDRPVPLRDPVESLFTRDELDLVDEVIEELWDQTAADVSDASHDIRWRALNHMDAMPYELVHLSDEPISDAEQQRTRQLAQEFGW